MVPATRAPRAEATVSRPDPDIRRVEQSPLSRTVILTRPQYPPRHRVERKERSPLSVPITEQPSVTMSILVAALPGDSVPNWFAPMMDKMLTMFASQHPPTKTPAVTVQSPVAVSPPDNPTLPTLPENASKDRLSARQNIRITPDTEMELSEEDTSKPDEEPVVTRVGTAAPQEKTL